jgi:hypothetical protein
MLNKNKICQDQKGLAFGMHYYLGRPDSLCLSDMVFMVGLRAAPFLARSTGSI